MSNTAIHIENLSKRYRIGLREERPETFVGAITSWFKSPLANFRQLRRLSHFGENDHDLDDIIWALKDISFTVKAGEVVGIIGHNGAGKSTLLKILSHITEPTAGRAIINGRVSSLLEVGTGFHPELTGRENVYLNGTILGMSKQEVDRKFDEIVDFSGVEKFIDTPVKRYSSGMQVRLAFAVAAHLEPEILLVDEVLAVGDAGFQKKCLGKMENVATQGRTIFFVSHNMEAIQRLCQRCVLLDQGRVRLDGTPKQVVSEYLKQWHETRGASYKHFNGASSSTLLPEKVTLVEAELLNAEEKPCQHINFGEPFTIRMLWRHHSHVAGLHYFIRIYDNNDRFLCAANTINVNLPIEEAGMHEVLCKFDHNVFVPGDYSISIGCYIRPKTTVHVAEHCLGLVVLNVAHRQNDIMIVQGNPVFALPSSWKRKETKPEGKPGLLNRSV